MKNRSGPDRRWAKEEIDVFSFQGHDRTAVWSAGVTAKWRHYPCPNRIVEWQVHPERSINRVLGTGQCRAADDGASEHELEIVDRVAVLAGARLRAIPFIELPVTEADRLVFTDDLPDPDQRALHRGIAVAPKIDSGRIEVYVE